MARTQEASYGYTFEAQTQPADGQRKADGASYQVVVTITHAAARSTWTSQPAALEATDMTTAHEEARQVATSFIRSILGQVD